MIAYIIIVLVVAVIAWWWGWYYGMKWTINLIAKSAAAKEIERIEKEMEDFQKSESNTII